MLNSTLWKRAFFDAVWLMAGCTVLMFAFHWLFIYLTSFVSTPAFADFLQSELPKDLLGMFGMPLDLAAGPKGRLAMAYVDPTVVVISAIWAIARGSDAVSGPLDRGTLEMILAQPVSRFSVLLAQVAMTVLGAVLIAAAALAGTAAGIATVNWKETHFGGILGTAEIVRPLSELVSAADYLPAAVSLFALTLFAAGLTTLVSSVQTSRKQTIGLVGSFYLLQVVMKVVGLTSTHKWIFKATFLGAYWPQKIVAQPEAIEVLGGSVSMGLFYNGILIGGGLACLVAAFVVFARRDLPAPL